MAETSSPEDAAKWHKRFAVECNNRAWRLSEAAQRSEAEDEEMLLAAHAAAYHWGRIGTPLHVARARMLLGHVLALLRRSGAMEQAKASFDYVMAHESPAWEIAFAHAILANAASSTGDRAIHRRHYEEARSLGAALSDAEERDIFDATFARIPAP